LYSNPPHKVFGGGPGGGGGFTRVSVVSPPPSLGLEARGGKTKNEYLRGLLLFPPRGGIFWRFGVRGWAGIGGGSPGFINPLPGWVPRGGGVSGKGRKGWGGLFLVAPG